MKEYRISADTKINYFYTKHDYNKIYLGSCVLLGLSFFDIHLMGDMDIISDPESFLELEYIGVKTSDHSFVNANTDSLNVRLVNSTFRGSRMELYALLTTNATVFNCIFLHSKEADNSVAATGLGFKNDGAGNHVIIIEKCRFNDYRSRKFTSMQPFAVFTIMNQHSESNLRVDIIESSFFNNFRAVDLSIIGESEVNLYIFNNTK